MAASRQLAQRERGMPTTIYRLYDSYADASRVIIALKVAGLVPSETGVISNNSDAWYKAAERTNIVSLQKPSTSSETASEDKFEGAAIGATAATEASLVTMLALPGIGAVVGVGWLAVVLGNTAIGGVTGGLLEALTNAGISEDDAQVFVEGVRRGGTLVAGRVPPADIPRMEPIMNRSAVKLQERCELYRRSGWQAFDPNATPYTADQVRSERALHRQ
jgi:hypothetical protein